MLWILDVLLALLYPPTCPGCARSLRRPGAPRLCGACRQALGSVVDPCLRCGEPGAGPCCESCARRPPPFGRTLACCVYREGSLLAEAISRWKYEGDPEVGIALERLFAERTARQPLCYDLVVPVPLHRSKLRRRGFNQSALLARALTRARPGAGSFAPGVLKRPSAGSVQAGLGRLARERNAREAFAVRRRVAGRRVLLVDDVLTSGATASSCTRALMEAGAAVVDVAVLARTPKKPGNA